MRQRVPLLLALAGLLVVAVLVARGGSGVPHGKGAVVAAAPPPATTTAAPQSVQAALGRDNPAVDTTLTVSLLIVLACFLVLVAGALGLWRVLAGRRLRRRRLARYTTATEDESGELTRLDLAALQRGARAAVVRLRQRVGGPPSDAVQEAWLALEESATEHGTAHAPEQTATEFTDALLAEQVVDADAVIALRTLYQRARFGVPGRLTEADVATAIAALERIAADLGGAPTASSGVAG